MEHQYAEVHSERLFQALSYAKIGWPVLPLHNPREDGKCSCSEKDCSSIGKHPRTSHGIKDASKSPLDVCNWWQRWPYANIGIATGTTSGLLVVDIDPRHGGDESWKKFVDENPLPPSLTAQSGGGGFHIYYKISTQSIKNRTNVLPGVDIRGEGGYIVAPSSQHQSGKFYSWQNILDQNQISDLPVPLLDLINGKTKSITSRTMSDGIPEGTRDDTLASVAGVLRRNGLQQDSIAFALSSLNNAICNPPLEQKEIYKIARSISRYESSLPEPDWQDPQPIREIKSFVPKMGEEYLTEALKPWAADICERMQIPYEFIAAPLVVSLSSVIGRQLGLYPKQKDDWLVIPNLWGAVVARPGFFKSPAIAEALKPLEGLVKKERIKYESALLITNARADVVRAKIEGIKENVKKCVRKGNPHEIGELQSQLEEAMKELEGLYVKEKRFKTNDATVEKIGAILLDNPEGLLIFRDELSGWLKNLQKAGREGDREFFLESWNGYGSYTVDRVGRGTLHIPSVCLSVFGGLQPGKLDSYVNQALYGGDGDDGLLQRFQILVYPDCPKTWRNIDRNPKLEHLESLQGLFERLSNLHMENIETQHRNIKGIRFEKGAQNVFNAWREDLEKRLRSDESEAPAFESHIAKYRSLVPSLALIFHLCEQPQITRDSVVGEASIKLAIKWSALLEAHAKKVYSNVIYSDLTAAHALAAKIKQGAVQDRCTVRSIYRKCWANLENSKQVDKAIAVLEDLGWLKVDQVKMTFRTKDELILNPRLNLAQIQ